MISNILSVISIFITILIAVFTNKISKKSNEQSNELSKISNELSKQSLNVVKKYSDIDYKVVSENSSNSMQKQMEFCRGESLVGITLDFNKTLALDIGDTSNGYIYFQDPIDNKTHIKNINVMTKNKASIDIKFKISLKDKQSNAKLYKGKYVLSSHFFEILIDKSKHVHCFLHEVLAETDSSSDGNTKTTMILSNDTDNNKIYFRVFDDYEMFNLEQEIIRNKKWIDANEYKEISNYGKTLENQDEFLKLYDTVDIEEIEQELADIKKRVNILGFIR